MTLEYRITRDSLLDAAAFLIRDMGRVERYRRQVSNMPKLEARYQGEGYGLRTALAYLAGQLGYLDVDEFIGQVRTERPSIAAPNDRPPELPPVKEAAAAAIGLAAATLRADAADHWPIDHEAGE